MGGLDPTLGAILPLVGVVIGGLLNVAIAAVASRRRLAIEAKVAARLVSDDLLALHGVVSLMLTTGHWHDGGDIGTFANWREHRVTLARVLTRQEWRLLRITFSRMERVAGRLRLERESGGGALTAFERKLVVGANDYMLKSLTMLDGVADIGLHKSRKRWRPTRDEVRSGLFSLEAVAPLKDEWTPSEEGGPAQESREQPKTP